jgi:hypothetical protein
MEFKCFREWTASATNYSTFFSTSAAEDVTESSSKSSCFHSSHCSATCRSRHTNSALDSLWSSSLLKNSEDAISLNDPKWNPTSTCQPLLYRSRAFAPQISVRVSVCKFLHVGRRRIKNVNTATPHLNPSHSTIIQRNIHIHPQRKKSYQECGRIPTPHTFTGRRFNRCQKQVATFVLYPVCRRPVLVYDMLMFGD